MSCRSAAVAAAVAGWKNCLPKMTRQNFDKPEMTSPFLICLASGFAFEYFLFSKRLVGRPRRKRKKINFGKFFGEKNNEFFEDILSTKLF